jgi:hypothetical protein
MCSRTQVLRYSGSHSIHASAFIYIYIYVQPHQFQYIVLTINFHLPCFFREHRNIKSWSSEYVLCWENSIYNMKWSIFPQNNYSFRFLHFIFLCTKPSKLLWFSMYAIKNFESTFFSVESTFYWLGIRGFHRFHKKIESKISSAQLWKKSDFFKTCVWKKLLKSLSLEKVCNNSLGLKMKDSF